MTAFLEGLSDFIGGNPWLSLVVAFFAGILTSFTPCSLSSIPLVIGYTAGYSGKPQARLFVFAVVLHRHDGGVRGARRRDGAAWKSSVGG